MRTIHVYRAARDYFIDGIYWGEMTKKACGSISTSRACPPGQITQALAQVAQGGTSIIQQPAGTCLVTEVG